MAASEISVEAMEVAYLTNDTSVEESVTSDNEFHDEEGFDNIPEAQSVGIADVTPNGTRFWIPDVDNKPEKGTVFAYLDHAFEFYSEYANKGGFEVRKGGQYHPRCGTPTSKYLYCSRQGFKNKPAANDGSSTKLRRRRPSKRCGCDAHIRLNKIDDGAYEVRVFSEKHNHSLVHKSDVQFLRAYRQLNYSQKSFLHQVSHANLGPVKGFKIMKQLYGGFQNIGATSDDCKNFRRDMNLFIGDRDAQMVVEKLISKKKYQPGFSVEYMTDNTNSLSGLFWADSDSKRNYFTFGDVVSFDATFRSNKYKMVFVPFTGIDNHNRCVTFGAGLISKENTESYKWLLNSFLKAFGEQPKIVVTDQDPAMKIAIEEVFPDSRHRLCMWHIMQKLTTKVGTQICNSDTFKKRLCAIIWTDKIGPCQFEMEWVAIINDFNLQENKWLQDMYEMRCIWIPAYFRDEPLSGLMRTSSRSESENHFFGQLTNNKWLQDMYEMCCRWIPAYFRDEPLSGLMRTSSRSESENHFFGQLTNTNLTLVEFLSHFETAMDVQRYTHAKNDHDTRYTKPDFKTLLEIESQASQIYTRTIFYDVQDEIYAALMHCHSIGLVNEDGFKRCVIQDGTQDPNKHDEIDLDTYEVTYNPSDGSILCTCKRYECYGLLCRHIFLVLKMFNVRSFPKQYVQRRWSREALPPNPDDGKSKFDAVAENTNGPDPVIREVTHAVDYCVNRLVGDMDKLMLYRDHQKELMIKADLDIPNRFQHNKSLMIGSLLGVSEPSEVEIHVPTGIRNKGCGSHKRLKSKIEIAITAASKKRRTCGGCGKKEGHNTKTCPYKNVASTSNS